MAKTTQRTGKGKRDLLKDKSLTKVPRGKVVHHKNPLSSGGSDTKRNVKIISKKRHREMHKKK